MKYLKKQEALNLIYARAASALFYRVATALANLGMGEFRWLIIRNFLRTATTVRGQYTTLKTLHNILISP